MGDGDWGREGGGKGEKKAESKMANFALKKEGGGGGKHSAELSREQLFTALSHAIHERRCRSSCSFLAIAADASVIIGISAGRRDH